MNYEDIDKLMTFKQILLTNLKNSREDTELLITKNVPAESPQSLEMLIELIIFKGSSVFKIYYFFEKYRWILNTLPSPF